MSTKDPTPFLEAAKTQYLHQKLIGLLGPPKCGKTVVAALLHNAIVKKFLQDHSDYRLRINDGGVDFLKYSSMSLRNGEFPEKTPEAEINKIDMQLIQDLASGGSIDLKLYDIAGEVYDALFEEELQPNDLLYLTLTYGKGKTEQFGPTSFLIFCKMYVFLIDCAKFKQWPDISFENLKILNAMLKWKKAIGQAPNNKLNIPIAIMLTKVDLLDEAARTKPVNELLKEHMPDFYYQLESILEAKKEFFKLYIDVERDADNKPKIIKVETPISENTEHQQSPSPDGQNNPESLAVATVAKVPKVNIIEKYVVKTPLSYSENEYVRFITWIDQTMKG